MIETICPRSGSVGRLHPNSTEFNSFYEFIIISLFTGLTYLARHRNVDIDSIHNLTPCPQTAWLPLCNVVVHLPRCMLC